MTDERQRTEDLLREWQRDTTNPLRTWGELDCLIELRILDEMEEKMKKTEIAPSCVVAKVKYRDQAYIAYIATEGGRTFSASSTASARHALMAALDKWSESEARIALKMGIRYGE